MFEYHFTISTEGIDWKALEDFAHDFKLKLLTIQLDKGQYPKQTMLTCVDSKPNIVDMVNSLTHFFKYYHQVIRVKVEQPLRKFASTTPLYSEAHYKILASDCDKLQDLIQNEKLHLSKNSTDGLHKFLTYRLYNLLSTKATFELFEKIKNQIESECEVVKSIYEEVLLDTNLNLDAGW